MEIWRTESEELDRPKVFSGRHLTFALLLHLAAFAVFWIFAALHGLFQPKEVIIPIDLTVVVNENLNGVENEPPPVKNPEPPPPPKQKPKPKPKPKPEPPKEKPKPLEQIVTNVVKTVEKPKEKPKDKPKDPPKAPEKPEKSAKELREERLKRMRESAVKNKGPVKIEVKVAKESGNGKTARQTMSEAEIRKLLGMGYKPGTSNQLAASDLQLGASLVKMALDEKWLALAPKVGRSGTVVLSCRLNSAGGLVNVRIEKTSGDSLSDKAALSVASRVTSIPSLPPKFVSQFMKETLTINYKVEGR